MKRLFRQTLFGLAALAVSASFCLSLSGCAVALIAGGAAGGVLVANHMNEDQRLRKEKEEEKKKKDWLAPFKKNEED